MKWGREVLLPANPDLADILGDIDLDFENFNFSELLGLQTFGFPGPQISKIWPLAGLGTNKGCFLFRILVFELATPCFV